MTYGNQTGGRVMDASGDGERGVGAGAVVPTSRRAVQWRRLGHALAVAGGAVASVAAQAQGSPFATGATAFEVNLIEILTPVAIVAVMVLGVAAWFNRISWSWVVGGMAGIVLVFGSAQVVDWVRGMFAV